MQEEGCSNSNKCVKENDLRRPAYEDYPYYCVTCACFPSTVRVSLENGKSVTMSELQVGDKVQTGKMFRSIHLVLRF